MSRKDMAELVKDATIRGLYVTWKEGSDIQIAGRFLNVYAQMHKEDSHGRGQYLGWCSLSRREELTRIVAENRSSAWRQKLKRWEGRDDGTLSGGIALALRRCSNLEADRLSMAPDNVITELTQVRRDLEVLFERALERGV